MGQLRRIDPSLLVVACFSRHPEALTWAEERLVASFGPVALASPSFAFHHTTYYEKEMGADLVKRFLAFERLVSSDSLPELKLHANTLEAELGALKLHPEPRPINLDPGLLQLGKFLLATTKDQAHRIYLRDGIFAEVTLRFQDGAWHPWPWTYADYREPDWQAFLLQARDYYRGRLHLANTMADP